MTRWLGIDHGTRRIGVAVGDTSGGIATPLTVLPAEPAHEAIDRIVRLCQEYEARCVVVGWPLNMDDSEGPQGRTAREMAEQLAGASGLDVRLWDERLSTFEADSMMVGKLTREKKRRRRDAVAAAVILQDFLSRGGPDAAPVVHQEPGTDDRQTKSEEP